MIWPSVDGYMDKNKSSKLSQYGVTSSSSVASSSPPFSSLFPSPLASSFVSSSSDLVVFDLFSVKSLELIKHRVAKYIVDQLV
ncbi:hypothetical protein PVK06_027042 [Gossypium arboreum]|uniref:Uncharacterized protein n=1 Tax=Gossypium arboreum TaxID=29729 RepID=A0ABR0NZ77_GOSAR|nr:hypothetical protein PVK06_027042 [Gossypium arboreum]